MSVSVSASANANEVGRIADQLERAVRGEAWHGPSLLELLSDVDEAAALRRPVPEAHSIAELVLHVIAWQDEALRRLEGKGHDLSPVEDWPEGARAAWSAVTDRLRASTESLVTRIRALDPSRLDEKVSVDGGDSQRYSTYQLLHGVVQHHLYHAGQIAILKKA